VKEEQVATSGQICRTKAAD